MAKIFQFFMVPWCLTFLIAFVQGMHVNLLSVHDLRCQVLLRMRPVPPRETKISAASRYLGDLGVGPDVLAEADFLIDSSRFQGW